MAARVGNRQRAGDPAGVSLQALRSAHGLGRGGGRGVHDGRRAVQRGERHLPPLLRIVARPVHGGARRGRRGASRAPFGGGGPGGGFVPPAGAPGPPASGPGGGLPPGSRAGGAPFGGAPGTPPSGPGGSLLRAGVGAGPFGGDRSLTQVL